MKKLTNSGALKKAKLSFSEYDLLSGLEYKTWEMNQALGALASVAHVDSEFIKELDLIITTPNDRELFNQVAKKHPVFANALKHFLEDYGWKSTGTYQAFSATCWNEDISSLLTLMRSYQAESENKGQGKYEALTTKIIETIPTQKAKVLMRQIKAVRSYHVNRELDAVFA